jgi:hypothetical protein
MTARKTLFAALAAATAVAAVAAPAAAQGYGYGHQARYERDRDSVRWNSDRAGEFERRIDVGLRNGELTRREHAQLSRELDQIARLEANYRRHGMDYRERADLDRRYAELTQDIKSAARDRDRRDYGYGYRR